jgi:anti-sigma28 factor (negative regulator of flagellin synthesis)
MKISGLGPLSGIQPSAAASKSSKAERAGSDPAVQVKMSGEAKWISELRSSAQNLDAVRMDVVEETRAQLANGTFDSSVDLGGLVDSLLGEL